MAKEQPEKPDSVVSPIERLPIASVNERRSMLYTAIVAGLVAGVVASLLALRYWPGLIPVAKQQILVQQSSAIIDVVKKVSPSVVSISSQTTTQDLFGFGQTQSTGEGTGIVVSADGLILTNKHVVPSDASNFSVFTASGKEYKDAKVIARDSINDIAFVKINASGLTPVQLGDSSNIQVGQEVIAIGNALGQFKNSATVGIISGIARSVEASDQLGGSAESLQNLFQTDAAINPGNSGGPLIDLSGHVIGINTAVAGDAQSIGFAIPINEVKPLLDSVKQKGHIVHPYIGVRYVPITADFASANNLPVTHGAYVSGDQSNPAVVPDGPAAKAGLQDGDIITKVNSDTISDQNSLTALVGKYKVGDKVTLTIIRDGKTITKSVALGEAPQG